MTTEQNLVKDFMLKFQQEVPDKPTIPNEKIRRLRAELILEEAVEAINALGFTLDTRPYGYPPDLIAITEEEVGFHSLVTLENIADALGDLHYVAYCGTGIACGLDMEEVFKEIHRSNMSKLWDIDDIKLLKGEEGSKDMLFKNLPVTVEEVLGLDSCNNYLYLVRNNSGKVIKSPAYSEANLKPIIEGQKHGS